MQDPTPSQFERDVPQQHRPKTVGQAISRQLRPGAPRQRRNDRCHCGSGRKFKDCCRPAPGSPALGGGRKYPVSTLYRGVEE